MMSKFVLDRFISLMKPRILCRLRKQEKLVFVCCLDVVMFFEGGSVWVILFMFPMYNNLQ